MARQTEDDDTEEKGFSGESDYGKEELCSVGGTTEGGSCMILHLGGWV